jgi:hypothetical protein
LSSTFLARRENSAIKKPPALAGAAAECLKLSKALQSFPNFSAIPEHLFQEKAEVKSLEEVSQTIILDHDRPSTGLLLAGSYK